jgi:hypothetical protein
MQPMRRTSLSQAARKAGVTSGGNFTSSANAAALAEIDAHATRT